MNNYKSKNHSKFLLQFHLILGCKYRKKLFENDFIDQKIIELCNVISCKHQIKINKIKSDKDHLHLIIETKPTDNLVYYVRALKSYTTFHIWKFFSEYLSKHFWKEKTFWTDGYFISSIGNVSENILMNYIENQG